VRRSYQASSRQIALGSRQACPEEAAHQRAGKNPKVDCESSDSGDPSVRTKQCLKETPAIRRYANEIEGKLPKSQPFDTCTPIGDECLTQLSPAGSGANVDQGLKARLTKVQHIPWRRGLELGEQRRNRNTWEFTDQLGTDGPPQQLTEITTACAR
jgi:hypothetical protein